MKHKTFFFTAVLLIAILLCGFSTKQDIPVIINYNQRFVKVDDNFFVDKYEVTIKDYQLFLKERKEKGLDNSLVIYDSAQWGFEAGFSANEGYFFNYETQSDYPIVCISHNAAKEFCDWVTEKYNANPGREYKKVIFRLPTEEEFVKVASSNYDPQKIFYPWGNNLLFDPHKTKLCNFFMLNQEDLDYNNGKLEYHNILNSFNNGIELVGNYAPNPLGVYDIVGNVSEMTQENHIAMGGDWKSSGFNVKITSKKEYDKADVSVGFRVYMEIIEK
jgi:formylglycine-generating enzyme required for sulfatase activity